MTSFKKVYVQKFRDNAAAVDYADDTGWHYLGRRGIFKKYDLYSGLDVVYARKRDINGNLAPDYNQYQLRIFQDGYAELFVDYETGIASQGRLPTYVYRSPSEYKRLQEEYSIARDKVREAGFILEGPAAKKGDFRLYEPTPSPGGIGYLRGNILKTVSTYEEAVHWSFEQYKNSNPAKES